MRNKLLLIAVLFPVVLACGLSERIEKAMTDSNSNITIANTNTNKSLTDQAVDTAVGEEKIGIAECDEALDVLAEQANNPDDNFVTKAVKKTALNSFRDQLKKSLEDNKADKKEVAKFCKEFRDNMKDSLTDTNSNSNSSSW